MPSYFFNNQPRRKLIPQGQPTKQQQHEQVTPAGLEPAARGLKARCSTN